MGQNAAEEQRTSFDEDDQVSTRLHEMYISPINLQRNSSKSINGPRSQIHCQRDKIKANKITTYLEVVDSTQRNKRNFVRQFQLKKNLRQQKQNQKSSRSQIYVYKAQKDFLQSSVYGQQLRISEYHKQPGNQNQGEHLRYQDKEDNLDSDEENCNQKSQEIEKKEWVTCFQCLSESQRYLKNFIYFIGQYRSKWKNCQIPFPENQKELDQLIALHQKKGGFRGIFTQQQQFNF